MEWTGFLIWLTIVGFLAQNFFAGRMAISRRVNLIRKIEHKTGAD